MSRIRPLKTSNDRIWIPEDYFARAEIGEIFPDADGRVIEFDMGCGDGGFLVQMAQHHPEHRFLGVERLLGRVRKVSRKLKAANAQNARLLRLESQYALDYLLPESSVDRMHFLFPDPWPKEKHARRRLFSEPFLMAIKRVLKPGGELLFKTDHDDYFELAQEVVKECGDKVGFERLEWPEDAFFYPITDFEQQWLDMGKTIDRMRLRFD
ncbi:tRNA (guanosine(46)-N7)-methyltransferase TrmB [Sulfuriroseicoccus oceanibius]|uniref:tRNA (guanine-N(7)-)-methyltransferase n=1 Tax=Sulfuriroseicoccus oceanibius TaxID=2707525 RepID=A0A6B3LEF3_9BACT|nr:tRNA (guanosine(46)-N7)-methyltransferase TrmB [Sulfuriroseicoccus oceanibius]QQL45790.1 tRNA (guanosine(46)-N7)-methyltransferase TrmB [Sulfuriroseicoccus oceanibius]